MDTKTPITFISAELASLSPAENQQRTIELREDLDKLGLAYTQATGVYQGKSEASFMIAHRGGTSGDYWPRIVRLAEKYSQESLLHVGSDRHGSLYFIDSAKWKPVGKLRAVSKEFAERHEAYSIVNGAYWYCGK